MQITNLTSNAYDLPGLRLHPSETVTFDVARYTGDDRFRLEVNTLVANGKISVASAPIGFPIQTALEAEIARGEVPGAATPGGFQPVSCILGSGETDVSAPGLYGFKPVGVFNNVYDGAPLSGIPDGLGWSIATDGSDDVITVTESGLYSWTWLVEFADGNDATFTGEMGDSFAIAKKQLNQVVGCQVEDANTTYEFVSGIGQLPAGAQARFFFKTSTAFATSPYRITSNLSIARLA